MEVICRECVEYEDCRDRQSGQEFMCIRHKDRLRELRKDLDEIIVMIDDKREALTRTQKEILRKFS